MPASAVLKLPRVYTSVENEYKAATTAAAMFDRSHIGRIRVGGKDGLDLLNRLSTNKLDELAPGEMMPTALTNNKGRVIDMLFVHRRDDDLLVFTSPQTREAVMEHIDFYTFVEDVSLEDVTDSTSMFGLLGPNAPALIRALCGTDVAAMQRHESVQAKLGGADVTILRSDFAGSLPAFDIFMQAEAAQAIWSLVLDHSKDSGVRPVGTDTMEILRVEQGVPVFGKDVTDANNPLEANLKEDFISFNKGCYIGQEVVARLDTYDKVQRRLVGLVSVDGSAILEGGALYRDGKKVGAVTSAVRSPALGEIAMGYVRRANAEEGVELVSGSPDSGVRVRVKPLPF